MEQARRLSPGLFFLVRRQCFKSACRGRMPQKNQQPVVIEDTVLQLLQSDSGARAPKGKMALVLLILPLS